MDASGGFRRRSGWPYLPSQKILLVAGIGILAGTALPWVLLFGKAVWGTPLAVSWTLWAGIMVLASAAVRWRTIVLVSAFIGGGVALYFGAWQTLRIMTTCFSFHCLPGPGLGLLVIGGIAALYQVVRMVRGRAAA